MERSALVKLGDAIVSPGLVSPRWGFRNNVLRDAFRGLTPPATACRPAGADGVSIRHVTNRTFASAQPFGTPHSALRIPHSRRHGFTLVELLVVVVIALSITAIAIPLLVPSQDERRLLEASRLVTTGMAAARSRAIETRRPAGLVLERADGQPDACFQLSFAEVPAPWAGGYINSRIHVGEWWFDTNSDGIVDSGELTDLDGDGAYDGGIVAGFTDGGGTDDVYWQGLVRRYDQIKLNYRGNLYTIYTDDTNVDANGFIIALGDTATTCWRLSSDSTSVSPVTPAVDADASGDINYADPTESSGHPFQVIRQPYRSALAPIQLPISVAIDLTSSDVNGSFLGTWYGDITILFTPGGAVQRVYQAGDPTVPVLSSWVVPTSPIYLLVGKRQFIPSNPAPQEGEPVYNFQDLQARWIGINPATGMVASAPPAAADLTATVDANTWATRLYESRQFIREGKTIGDK